MIGAVSGKWTLDSSCDYSLPVFLLIPEHTGYKFRLRNLDILHLAPFDLLTLLQHWYEHRRVVVHQVALATSLFLSLLLTPFFLSEHLCPNSPNEPMSMGYSYFINPLHYSLFVLFLTHSRLLCLAEMLKRASFGKIKRLSMASKVGQR